MEFLTPQEAIIRLKSLFETDHFPLINTIGEEIDRAENLEDVFQARLLLFNAVWSNRGSYSEHVICTAVSIFAVVGLEKAQTIEQKAQESAYTTYCIDLLRANGYGDYFNRSQLAFIVNNCQLKHCIENRVGDLRKIVEQITDSWVPGSYSKKQAFKRGGFISQVIRLLCPEIDSFHVCGTQS